MEEELSPKFDGIALVNHQIFNDDRGTLSVLFSKTELSNLQIDKFVQQNHVVSNIGVIRGIHWQHASYAQGKLITCQAGSIFDVFVDLRKSSQSFGKWGGITLSSEDSFSIWIPKGFGHGFQALESNSEVLYSLDNDFYPEKSSILNPLDPHIGIEWPIRNLSLSLKDSQAPDFRNLVEAELFE